MSSNRVRIIGCVYRSRILRFPTRPGLRPTPDRVRETLFNWLGQDLTGQVCLDLFAGSGALGFEALSRGATHVTLVENDPRAFSALGESARKLNCGTNVELYRRDALEFSRRIDRTYDLVFVDAPFDSGLTESVMPFLPRLLRSGAKVYVESATGVVTSHPWQSVRQGAAGNVRFELIQYGDD